MTYIYWLWQTAAIARKSDKTQWYMANVLAKFNFDKRFCGKTDLICDAWQEKIFHIFIGFFKRRNGILLTKLFWPTVRKKCSSDREILLRFETEGREFAKCLRALKHFFKLWKVRTIFETECFLNLFLEVFLDLMH